MHSTVQRKARTGSVSLAATLLSWCAVAIALPMLALTLVPVGIWNAPKTDFVYKGFDSNLISISPIGFPFTQRGAVLVTPQSVRLNAVPNSLPSFHLLTGRLSNFNAAMTVTVLNAPIGTVPLRIGVWSPRSKTGYFLAFGPGPTNLLSQQLVKNGGPAQTLLGGDVKQETLGSYSPGQNYHLEITVDKKSGVIETSLSGNEAPPTYHRMLAIVGGPADVGYADVVGNPVKVVAGRDYTFGGLLKVKSGSDAYKLVLGWLDNRKNFLGYTGDWRGLADVSGWTPLEFKAKAPAKAAFAELYLGSGNGTVVLFSDLFIRNTTGDQTNLIRNGDLRDGARGWSFVRRPSGKLDIIDPHPVSYVSRVTTREAPQLLQSVNLSLTASASSSVDGTSSAVLTDYSLTLPHQRYLAEKVADPRAKTLLDLLLLLGGFLVVARATVWVWESFRRRWRRSGIKGSDQKRVVPKTALVIFLLALVAVTSNLLLFGVGREPFDMGSQEIWAYVAARYGPAQIYYLPNIVSMAQVWGGVPYAAAAFAYEPVLAYFFTAIGWIQPLFFSGPAGPAADTLTLEFLIKAANLLFGMADGLLIYLILKQTKAGRRWSLIGAAFFLLNPAVWFGMSVLGLTEVVSVFFALLSVWLAETKHPVAAWLALSVTSLARPQMLVIAFLLGLVFLRKFSWRENLRGAAWSTIFAFMLLGPFTLKSSPSLPVDVMANTLYVQEAGGNEAELTTVSVNAYSVWPMVTYIVDRDTGLARIFHPSADRLVGSLTYQRVGQLLTAALMLLLAGIIALRRKQLTLGAYLPALAVGISGFLILMTGIGAAHFILALPFLILCSKWLGRIPYLLIVLVWTIAALVPMYGSFGGYVAVFQPTSSNAVSRLFVNIYSWDSFISAATVANVLVVLICLVATVRALASRTMSVSRSLQPEQATDLSVTGEAMAVSSGPSQRSNI